MHLVILDPRLSMMPGHQFELDTALLESVVELGATAHILSHHSDDARITGHPDITPFFDVYRAPEIADPMLRDLDYFMTEGERLLADLERLDDLVDIEDSAFIYMTADCNTLPAIGRWSRRLGRHRRRLFVLLPADFKFAMAGAGGTLDQLFYRYGFAQCALGDAQPAHFLTLSADQAVEYGRISGLDIGVAPYPVGGAAGREPAVLPPPAPGDRLRVLVCGTSRATKGFHLLPDLVAKILAARRGVEFVVQYSPTEEMAEPALALEALGARIVQGYLPRADYQALIEGAHVVLTPYIGGMYRLGTSAVFAEARWFGRPVVATAGTSMADAIAADPRIGVAAASLDGLAAAVIHLVDHYDAFARSAAAAGADYRKVNGTRAFAERLLALASG